MPVEVSAVPILFFCDGLWVAPAVPIHPFGATAEHAAPAPAGLAPAPTELALGELTPPVPWTAGVQNVLGST